MIKLKKILYPTDFSKHSLAALPYARDMAEKFSADLHVLHVVDSAYQYWMAGGEDTAPVVMSENELTESAQQQMDDFIEKNLSDYKEQITVKLIPGKPFLEIIHYARDQGIDMIVIATHGYGALTSMLIGSVTEKVLRKAPCPVMTIRHAEHKFEMP